MCRYAPSLRACGSDDLRDLFDRRQSVLVEQNLDRSQLPGRISRPLQWMRAHQHLMLMSAHPLQRSADTPWQLGPIKILLDEHALPPVEQVAEIIASARAQRRRVAAHCVTAGELALTLAAFDTAGS